MKTKKVFGNRRSGGGGMVWLAAWAVVVLLPSRASAEIPRAGIEGLRGRLGGASVPFLVNRGQVDPTVAYYAPTFAGTVYVTRAGRIVYSLPGRAPAAGARSSSGASRGWSLTETLMGGRARPSGQREAPTRISSFIGADPARWSSGLATYEEVSLGEVWAGVSVSLRAHGNNVEKLFTVQPGGDASRIRLRLAGAKGLQVNETGALVVATGLGDVVFTEPVAYQERADVRHPVKVAYELRGREYGFRLGQFDPALPVVIDPLLQATYLGGGGDDGGYALAIHPTSGEVYVAGQTNSAPFPGTTGGAQPARGGLYDTFVARLSADLTTLSQATYIGGSANDWGRALAIHRTSGEVYVAGYTRSTNFPGTAGGAQPASGGFYDAFVARLSADLTTLSQATYLGGGGDDAGHALAIHPTSGEVYVALFTVSTNFPGTAGGAQRTFGGASDACVARLNSALTTLSQATYLGGGGSDGGNALAIHPASGEVYVAGYTRSTDFPGTAGGAQPVSGGLVDAFVARLSADLTTLSQATYLGGGGEDAGLVLAIHPTSGEVYVAGDAEPGFPGTAGGAQPVSGGLVDVFVARLNSTLTTLSQATYLGGSNIEAGYALAIHPTSSHVYVAGQTQSDNFPGTAGGAQRTFGGGFVDAFVAHLNTDLTTLGRATYLGGGGNDYGLNLAIHLISGHVYVRGQTQSDNFPGTAGGAQPLFGSLSDAFSDTFVARLSADLAGINAYDQALKTLRSDPASGR